MLVALLIPVVLLLATVLLERFESRVVPGAPRPNAPRKPLRLEAAAPAPVADRHRGHLRAVPAVADEPPTVVDAPAAGPLRRAS